MSVPFELPKDDRVRHLECRDWGHAWSLEYLAREAPGLLVRKLNCLRCGGSRFDYLGRTTGEIDGRIYRYADGYLNKGEGKPDKQELRLELTKELMRLPAFKHARRDVRHELPRRQHHG